MMRSGVACLSAVLSASLVCADTLAVQRAAAVPLPVLYIPEHFGMNAGGLGAIPGDVPVRKDVRVELDIPPWCRGAQVFDLLSGERLAEAQPGRLPLTLGGLSGFRLLWIDADPGRAALTTLTRQGDVR